ncbi:MAG: hypothetical protein QM572_13480 [Nocardioides sp.]|uniref:hypothetical protein n=1 Tax=Nocardioides sp. TaxID=35761 RepID=UPI0039E66F24
MEQVDGHPRGRRVSRGGALLAYAWWAACGAAAGIGALSILTIGPFVLLGTGVLVVVGLAWGRLRGTGHAAALAGVGLAVLYPAWLNRQGPGTVCEPLGDDGLHCVDQWSPWPFVVLAILLLIAAIALDLLIRRLPTLLR